jgi:hypothetical protein
MKLVIGFILGFVVATTGFSTFANFVDLQLNKAATAIKENVQ